MDDRKWADDEAADRRRGSRGKRLLWLLLLLILLAILAGVAVAYMNRNKGINDPGTGDQGQANNTSVQNRIYAVSNPEGAPQDNVVTFGTDLKSVNKTYSGAQGVNSLEHIITAKNGDAFITADVGTANQPGGAIVVVTGFQNANNIGAGTRRIEGASTGLVGPKGIEISESQGLLFVADFGAKNVKVFRLDASGNQAPVNTVTNLGATQGVERSVWDLAYVNNTLYVTATDGVVLAYDNFTQGFGATGPSRTIIPTDAQGNKVGNSLRGIDLYTANGSATMIISDLSQPNNKNDGALYVLSNATGARGNTPISAQISGDKTTMGDPISVRVNRQNGDAFIADKINNRVLSFTNLSQSRGTQNTAPQHSLQVTSPESVSLAVSQ